MSGVLDISVAVGGTVLVKTGVEDGTDSPGRMVPTGVGDVSCNAPQAEIKKVRIRPQARKERERFFIRMFLQSAGMLRYWSFLTLSSRVAVSAMLILPG